MERKYFLMRYRHTFWTIIVILLLHDVTVYCDDEPRIVGGKPAELGEFKSIVSVQSLPKASHYCGGTLIDASIILTAAHCFTDEKTGIVKDASIVQVMGDDVSIDPYHPGPKRQVRKATQLFVHPNYSIRPHRNDLAIVKVKPPFDKTDTFTTAKLPLDVAPLSGTCQVAGWGRTTQGGSISPILLSVALDIVPIDICNRTYKGKIQPTMVCAQAADSGQDTCQGDSGGGLMCNSIVVGAVSFGKGCAVDRPKIFTHIYKFLPWISEVRKWPVNERPPLPTTISPITKPTTTSTPSITTMPMPINKILFIACSIAYHLL